MQAALRLLVLAGLAAMCDMVLAQAPYRPSGTVPSTTTYVFAPHPNLSPQEIFSAYQPVIRYLEQKIPGTHFMVEASKDYAEFEGRIATRKFDFAIPNPYQTVLSLEHGYRVIAKMAPDDEFRGLMLVGTDSKLKTSADLAGQKLCFISPSAVAATMLPRIYLHEHGVDPAAADIEYVGSAFSAITHVYMGDIPACGVALRQWRAWSLQNPDKVGKIRIMFTTATVPHNSVIARDDVPTDIARQVADVLIGMDKDKNLDQGRFTFEQNRYEPASNATYKSFALFLKRYDKTIGLPPEMKLPHHLQ